MYPGGGRLRRRRGRAAAAAASAVFSSERQIRFGQFDTTPAGRHGRVAQEQRPANGRLPHSVCSTEKFSLRLSQRATVEALLTSNNLLQNALETKKKSYFIGTDTSNSVSVW
jgi:hypothetical protein